MNCNYRGRKQAELNQRVIEVYLWFAMVTLNREMGFGTKRLNRFREGFVQTAGEFEQECQKYGTETAALHLRQRVQQVIGKDGERETS